MQTACVQCFMTCLSKHFMMEDVSAAGWYSLRHCVFSWYGDDGGGLEAGTGNCGAQRDVEEVSQSVGLHIDSAHNLIFGLVQQLSTG